MFSRNTVRPAAALAVAIALLVPRACLSMTVCVHQKLAYFHVPKCGGSSVNEILERLGHTTCGDDSELCVARAESGECSTNPEHMQKACRHSCGLCKNSSEKDKTGHINCDWQCYLDRYPDLQKEFGATNLESASGHWRDTGKKEGRDCTCKTPTKAAQAGGTGCHKLGWGITEAYRETKTNKPVKYDSAHVAPGELPESIFRKIGEMKGWTRRMGDVSPLVLLREWDTFATVRNPYVRVLGAFAHRKQAGYTDQAWGTDYPKDFASFMRWLDQGIRDKKLAFCCSPTITHFRPSTMYTHWGDGTQAVRKIIKLETMDIELDAYLGQFFNTSTELGAHRASWNLKKSSKSREALCHRAEGCVEADMQQLLEQTDHTNETIEIVSRLYKYDFELLGYNRIGNWDSRTDNSVVRSEDSQSKRLERHPTTVVANLKRQLEDAASKVESAEKRFEELKQRSEEASKRQLENEPTQAQAAENKFVELKQSSEEGDKLLKSQFQSSTSRMWPVVTATIAIVTPVIIGIAVLALLRKVTQSLE